MKKHYIGVLSFLVTLLVVLVVLLISTLKINAQATEFTFTAVGDHGARTNSAAVLDVIASARPAFHLALGDLSYGDIQPETAWCDFVKSHVGPDLPFELLAGNHDTGEVIEQGNINQFVACLPDRLGTIHGDYGKEYYFDYPAGAPLARFILISPRLNFQPGGYISYGTGSAHYNWVASAIDAARAANIPWVIVGMHKLCLGVSSSGCGIETSLFNLLISKKVDVILQAHDHNYQRSKQLALSSACASIAPGSYNPACVVDDGADRLYVKGHGPVIVVAGMGGKNLYNLNLSDPEAGYFAALMGANQTPTHGVMRYTLSETRLAAEFLPAGSGAFRDAFVIDSSGAPPPPTATPTLSLPLVLAADTFTRSVADSWSSADTGGRYTLSGAAANFDVNGSAGTIVVPGANQGRAAALNAVSVQDVDVRLRVKTDKTAAGNSQYVYFLTRKVASGTEYRGQIRFSTSQTVHLRAVSVVQGALTNLGREVRLTGLTHTANQFIRVRGQVVGVNPTILRLKAWADGQPEPADWQFIVSDSTADLQAAGGVGLRANLSSNVTNAPVLFTFDDFWVAGP